MKDFYKKLSGCLKDTELSGNKELIQLLTSMNNRIIELEKQIDDYYNLNRNIMINIIYNLTKRRRSVFMMI